MSARTERYLPLLIAIIAVAVAAFVTFTCEIGPLSKSLAAGAMTFGIVVAGFAATQRNMLLGMSGSSVLRFAVRTGLHNHVLAYLMHCVYAGLFVSLVSVTGFFLGNNALLWSLWLIILTGSIALVLALMMRNEIMIVRIVKRFMEEQNPRTR